MAALGAQTVASSYEQILHVDRDGGGNTTTHVSVKDGDNGTTFGFTIATDALMMTSTNRLEFGDNASYIHQSADGVLDLVSDTEIELTATTIDINGAVDMSSTLAVGGAVTVTKALSSDTQTTPETILTLGATYASTGTDGGAGSGSRIEFQISDDETNPITGAAIAGIKESADDSDASAGMAFYVSQNDTTLDEVVRIDHDGKVGIGTTSPSYRLHVAEDLANDYAAYIINDNADGSGLRLRCDDSDGDEYLFYAENSTTARFAIKSDGKVGIASAAASPSHLFDITANDGVSDNNAVARFVNAEATDGRSKGVYIRAGSTADDWPLFIDDHDASNNLLSLRGNGAFTTPKTPAFFAQPSTNQNNFAENTNVTVVLGTERFDQGSNFASNTFTAPVTGKYHFSASVYLTAIELAAEYYEIAIVASNKSVFHLFSPGGLDTDDLPYWSLTLSVLVDMDASDTCFLQVRQGGTSQDATADINTNSFFSGYLAC